MNEKSDGIPRLLVFSYDKEDSLSFPLDEDYYEECKKEFNGKSQQEKDDALWEIAINTPYAIGRQFIAALVRVGSNANDIKGIFSPLSNAIRENDYHLLKVLINHGADINAKDNLDQSPIQ